MGTKYLWTPEYAAAQQKMLDAATIEQKIPAFAAVLSARHSGKDWKRILQMTAAMMTALGSEAPLLELAAIRHPALLMAGDRDNTVSVQETGQVMQALEAGQLAVLPATPHPFEKVSIPLLAQLLTDFFS